MNRLDIPLMLSVLLVAVPVCAMEVNNNGDVGKVINVMEPGTVDTVVVSDDGVAVGSVRIRNLRAKSRRRFTCANWDDARRNEKVVAYVHGILDAHRVLFEKGVEDQISDDCEDNPRASLFYVVESVACSVVRCWW